MKRQTEPTYNGKTHRDWLRELVEDNEEARETLMAIGTDAVPVLTAALGNSDWRYRGYAASMLGALGSWAESSIPLLLEKLHGPEWRVRWNAGYALERHHNPGQPWRRLNHRCRCVAPPQRTKTPDQQVLLQALVPCLDDGSPEARVMTVAVLGRLESLAKPVLSLVKARLNDIDMTVRYYAQQALVQIDPEAAAKAGVTWPPAQDGDSAEPAGPNRGAHEQHFHD